MLDHSILAGRGFQRFVQAGRMQNVLIGQEQNYDRWRLPDCSGCLIARTSCRPRGRDSLVLGDPAGANESDCFPMQMIERPPLILFGPAALDFATRRRNLLLAPANAPRIQIPRADSEVFPCRSAFEMGITCNFAAVYMMMMMMIASSSLAGWLETADLSRTKPSLLISMNESRSQ